MTERTEGGNAAPPPAQLRRAYRAIRAPAGFTRRVAARLPDDQPRRRALWQPLTAAAALLLVLVVLAPQLGDRGPAEPPIPSLARLSAALPAKPDKQVPSLAQLRVRTPALPPRPAAPPPAPPQSRLRHQPLPFDLMKENTHG